MTQKVMGVEQRITLDTVEVRQGGPVGVRAAGGDQGADQVTTVSYAAALIVSRGSGPQSSRPRSTRRLRRSTPCGRSSATRTSIRRSTAPTWDRVGTELRPKAIAATNAGRVSRRAVATCSAASACRISRSSRRRPMRRADHVDLSGQPGFDARLRRSPTRRHRPSIPSGGAAAAGVHAGMDRAVDRRHAGRRRCSTDQLGMPPRLAQLEAWRLAVHAAARAVESHGGDHVHRRHRRGRRNESRSRAGPNAASR